MVWIEFLEKYFLKLNDQLLKQMGYLNFKILDKQYSQLEKKWSLNYVQAGVILNYSSWRHYHLVPLVFNIFPLISSATVQTMLQIWLCVQIYWIQYCFLVSVNLSWIRQEIIPLKYWRIFVGLKRGGQDTRR